MWRRLAVSVLAVAVAVGLAVGVSLITPLRRPPAQSVDLVRSTRLTCLPAGQAMILGTGPISSAALGEPISAGSPGPLVETIAGPSVMSSNSIIVGGVLRPAPSPGYTPCTAPMPTGMLQVLDPSNTELLLVNTDANESVVDLTLLGADGEEAAVGARGIAISPGASRIIALSVLAPKGPVGVLYTTSQGRVSVMARPLEGRTGESVIAAAPAASQTIAGIETAAPAVRLLVSNPTEDRLEVTVEALGVTSTYEPAPASEVAVPAKSTLVVDLGSSLGGEPSALRVSSTEPIGASVVIGAGEAQRSLLPGEPSTALGVQVADASVVQLSNPGVDTVAATITVAGTAKAVSVPAGRTLMVEGPSSARTEVAVASDGPLTGAVLSADGAVVYPLAAVAVDESNAGIVVPDPSLR